MKFSLVPSLLFLFSSISRGTLLWGLSASCTCLFRKHWCGHRYRYLAVKDPQRDTFKVYPRGWWMDHSGAWSLCQVASALWARQLPDWYLLVVTEVTTKQDSLISNQLYCPFYCFLLMKFDRLYAFIWWMFDLSYYLVHYALIIVEFYADCNLISKLIFFLEIYHISCSNKKNKLRRTVFVRIEYWPCTE